MSILQTIYEYLKTSTTWTIYVSQNHITVDQHDRWLGSIHHHDGTVILLLRTTDLTIPLADPKLLPKIQQILTEQEWTYYKP